MASRQYKFFDGPQTVAWQGAMADDITRRKPVTRTIVGLRYAENCQPVLHYTQSTVYAAVLGVDTGMNDGVQYASTCVML